MKRPFALFVVPWLFLSLALHAQDKTDNIASHISYDFSVAMGVQSAHTSEYVYYEDGDVMSRLDWNAYASPTVVLGGEVNVFHAIVDARFQTIVPLKCGTMEDWDYLKSDHTRPTNYSKSDLIMNKDYAVEATVGYEFLLKKFRVLPQAGFLYKNIKMEASGGYLQYGSLDSSNGGYWSEDLEKYNLVGTVITYEQQFFMPFLSLQAEWSFLTYWHAKLFGRWYPYIKCDAIDMHNERMTQFNDFMEDGAGFVLGTEMQYKRWAVSFSYEYTKCDSGNTTQRNFGHTTYLSDADSKPGAENSLFTVMITYHIK